MLVCSINKSGSKGGRIITIYCFSFDYLFLGGEIYFMVSVSVTYFRAVSFRIFLYFGWRRLSLSMMIYLYYVPLPSKEIILSVVHDIVPPEFDILCASLIFTVTRSTKSIIVSGSFF